MAGPYPPCSGQRRVHTSCVANPDAHQPQPGQPYPDGSVTPLRAPVRILGLADRVRTEPLGRLCEVLPIGGDRKRRQRVGVSGCAVGHSVEFAWACGKQVFAAPDGPFEHEFVGVVAKQPQQSQCRAGDSADDVVARVGVDHVVGDQRRASMRVALNVGSSSRSAMTVRPYTTDPSPTAPPMPNSRET